jgi:NDP-sugar pyrophosphorylase family protein
MQKRHLAVILVGGKGTRLLEAVSDRPKVLALVNGEPFINLLFKQLSDAGIEDILLLTGHMHDLVLKTCGLESPFGQKILYSQELIPLGTAGALVNAKDILCEWPEFLLLNGDTYFDASLAPVFNTKIHDDQVAIISAMYTNDCRRYGRLIFSEDALLEGFLEKENNINSGWVSNGICKLSNKILDFIPKGQMSSLEQDIFPKLLEQGYKIKVSCLKGFFHDIGLPESYAYFNFKYSFNNIKQNEVKALILTLTLGRKIFYYPGSKFNSKLEDLFRTNLVSADKYLDKQIIYMAYTKILDKLELGDLLIASLDKISEISKLQDRIDQGIILNAENITFDVIREFNLCWDKIKLQIKYLQSDKIYEFFLDLQKTRIKRELIT